MKKKSEVPLLEFGEDFNDDEFGNNETPSRAVSRGTGTGEKTVLRVSKSAAANSVREHDQTDQERMQEALTKYENNPYVVEIRSIRIGRDDGSTYIAPIIFVKPDLMIGSLVFPGARGGSSWSPID